MSAVLDTNVLVSGIFFGGVPRAVLHAWAEGRFELVLSPSIIDEYVQTCARLGASHPGLEYQSILATLVGHGTLVPDTTHESHLDRNIDTTPGVRHTAGLVGRLPALLLCKSFSPGRPSPREPSRFHRRGGRGMITHARTLTAVLVLLGASSLAPGHPESNQAPEGPAPVRPTPGDKGYRSTAADRRSVTLTVYNQNFGLVREIRDIAFTRGTAPLEFADVAQQIEPQTVHIRALNGGLRVLEQNYQYDLLNPQKLLEKYVGRTVTVYRYDNELKREVPVQAEVISVNGGPILRIGDEITFNYPGRFSFPGIPDNLIAHPTLEWLLESDRPRPRLEVSYLTNQMNWKADYVFVIDDSDTKGDLQGWVTLDNQSGATYENARLKLVAGAVQRVTPNVAGRMREEARKAMVADMAVPQFKEESFFEYHLYTLDRPTTLRENEQKQVTLLQASDVGLQKRLQFYGAAQYYRGQYGQVVSNQALDVFLEFSNTQKNHLGMALPKGTVRVYKADRSGAQQFIGEDLIDHTPRDEKVRIRMGQAFDVVGDRRQMAWHALSTCASESEWRVNVRNHKDEPVDVDIIEPVGGDWEIVSSSHKYEKLDAHTFRYRVRIGANDEVVVRYRVRVRWC